MALVFTLTVGAAAWWIATGWVDTPYTMGVGGPVVYLAVLVFIGAITLLSLRRQYLMAERTNSRRLRYAGLVSIRDAVLLAIPCVFIMGVMFGSLDVGDGPSSAWMLGVVLAIGFVPLALVVSVIGFRLSRSRTERPLARALSSESVDSWAVILALCPLLGPLMAQFCLNGFSSGEFWEQRAGKPALAGMVYYSMLPLMFPTAIVVAWGLDRLDGSRGQGLARAVMVIAVSTLVLGVAIYPGVIWSLYESDVWDRFKGIGHSKFDGYVSGIRFWRPFTTSVLVNGSDRLPLDGMFRGSSAMMLTASVLTAIMLKRVRNVIGREHIVQLGIALSLVLQVALSWWLIPAHGPSGAVWAATMGWVPALVAMLVPARSDPLATEQQGH